MSRRLLGCGGKKHRHPLYLRDNKGFHLSTPKIHLDILGEGDKTKKRGQYNLYTES